LTGDEFPVCHPWEFQRLGQVFWLTDPPTHLAFPFRFSETVAFQAFVPVYSGGTATDSHRLPYYIPLDRIPKRYI
jgi:hypothetical protein